MLYPPPAWQVRAAPAPGKAVAWAGSPPRRAGGGGGKHNRGKTWGKRVEKLGKVGEKWGKTVEKLGKAVEKLGKTVENLGKPMEFSEKMGT